ncbi:MAG TPA: tyrosine--tRNA ligase [Chitinophagaceae bacterium]|nr:tyrosine--tRNA ligase [Chitinophagaceae bacterium]
MNLIEELAWRGMLHEIMPGTEEQLNKEKTLGYIGFDPTADSLHIGSLVPILLLLHLQRAGHHPVALVGGATGMVGDPSGKSEERNLLDETSLQKNVDGIRKQLSKYLDFDPSHPARAFLVNNYDWFKEISFIHFLRDVGKHITVNYMMSKDSVRKRIEGETGISYTEFAYQLMQGYDFYWLYQKMGVKLQMGGSDQWGNIVTGTELIRRKAGGEAFAFTCPLITRADGGKFGKTEKGNVWLDPEKTSPYHFYQFWLNASDADAEKWIKIFTLLTKEDIEAATAAHYQDPSKRILQKKLAEEVTRFIHGQEELDKAIQTTEKLFSGNAAENIRELNEADLLLSLEGVPVHDVAASQFAEGVDVVSLLSDTGVFPSRGEARKMIQGGGVSVNKEKLTEVNTKIDQSYLLHGKYILVQKGKKNFYLIKAS